MKKIKTLIRLIIEGKYFLIKSEFTRIIGYLPDYPRTLYIEPNNTCNLKCPLCITGMGKMNRQPRYMRYEEFKVIIDQVKGRVKDIWLCNYGEPFLNKDIFSMINYAANNGISVYTSTNGMFFGSARICREVLDSGLKHLIITLDGADQDTLSQYRVGAEYDRIVNGYQQLLELRKKLSRTTPVIEMQFIMMKHNEHQKEQVRAIAESLGVDAFCEKTVGFDNRTAAQGERFLPNDLSNSRYERSDDGTISLKGEMKNTCHWINSTCVINSDGTVVPCCYDAFSEYIMGNVFKDDLKKIWKGTKYLNFRKSLKKNRKDIPMCNICSEGRTQISKTDKI